MSTTGQNEDKKRKKGVRSWIVYIRKVLAQVHPDIRITGPAMAQMNEVVDIIARKMSYLSREAAQQSGKKTIGENEVRAAVRLTLNGELTAHAGVEARKAMRKYEKTAGGTTGASVRREARAGLVFAVAKAEGALRMYGGGGRVGKPAGVYLAAVLEYLTAEILVMAGNVTRDTKMKTISTRFIYLAMQNDIELSSLYTSLRLHMINTGVTEFIDARLVPSDEQKKANAKKRAKARKEAGTSGALEEGEKRKRFPGALALSNIKKQQKIAGTVLQAAPFERNVRHITEVLNNESEAIMKVRKKSDVTFTTGPAKPRFESDAISSLQHVVEQTTIELLRDAQQISLNSTPPRPSINDHDVQLAWDLTRKGIEVNDDDSFILEETKTRTKTTGKGKKQKKKKNEVVLPTELGTDSGINKLMHRAGVKRKSHASYETVRSFMRSMLVRILSQCIEFTGARNALTVNVSDLKAGFRSLGVNVTATKAGYGTNKKVKAVAKKSVSKPGAGKKTKKKTKKKKKKSKK